MRGQPRTLAVRGAPRLRAAGNVGRQVLYTAVFAFQSTGYAPGTMGKLTDLLQLARARGHDLGLPYAGALTPQEAYDVWQLAPGARLIDVRTHAEWDWVGRIPGAVEIEWMSYPDNRLNIHFLAQVEQQVDREALLMFICRSGVRSHHAAALVSEARQRECYNVLEGFEGNKHSACTRSSAAPGCSA